MFAYDLHQWRKQLGITDEQKRELCPDWEDEHHALADAKWNYQLYQHLAHFSFCRDRGLSPGEAGLWPMEVTPRLFDSRFPG